MPQNNTLTAAPATADLLEKFRTLLRRPADELDEEYGGERAAGLVAEVAMLGVRRRAGDAEAFLLQQTLLAEIYALHLRLPDEPTAEGSAVLQAVTRRLERDTAAAEDARVPAERYAAIPDDPGAYVGWLKDVARRHPAFKHDYYHDFLRDRADAAALRRYVIQESVVDARFDDLLALVQLGTSGGAKLEIAANFWDEMGNGDPAEVHTTLFQRILDEFEVSDEELAQQMSAEALLSGNLAVLTCRYRQFFGEAVGYLAMTEWLVPDRFAQVLHAWRRLGLPSAAIVYHEVHIGVDARHASGWFANVVQPAAADPRMRRATTRGALWRLNTSARYLDQSLQNAR